MPAVYRKPGHVGGWGTRCFAAINWLVTQRHSIIEINIQTFVYQVPYTALPIPILSLPYKYFGTYTSKDLVLFS